MTHCAYASQNIVSLQATADRVFALSASGRIYVLSFKRSDQRHEAGAPTPSSDPWWGTGWMWGEDEDVDFAEIQSNEKLAWRERCVFHSIPLCVFSTSKRSTRI